MFENTSFFSCLIEAGQVFYDLPRLFFIKRLKKPFYIIMKTKILTYLLLMAKQHFSILRQRPHLVVDNHLKGVDTAAD